MPIIAFGLVFLPSLVWVDLLCILALAFVKCYIIQAASRMSADLSCFRLSFLFQY